MEVPLRFFVLGIGKTVSTAMCNTIARAGNGIAQFITNPTEGLTRKCARLLTAAMSPRPTMMSFSFSASFAGSIADDIESVGVTSKDALASPAVHSASNLCPGTRFHAYLLLSSPRAIPKSVTLHAQLASGERLSLDVPVSEPIEGSHPLIHPLVAQNLIQDFNLSDDSRAREMLISLAKTHNILSESTSFVSVDADSEQVEVRRFCTPTRPGRGRKNVRGQLSTLSTIATHAKQLAAIARHQGFDGSFHSAVLQHIDNVTLPELTIETDEVGAQIHATFCVIRFLTTNMKDEEGIWKMMHTKAIAFLQKTSPEVVQFL